MASSIRGTSTMQSNVIASNRPIPPRVMAVMRRMSRSRWATLAMLLFGLLGLSACGSRPGPVAAKSAVAKNTPSPSNVAAASGSSAARSSGSSSSGILLYAVVESHTKTNGLATYDTVAIAGLDGYARAKTTFTPATPPYVGCLGPLLPLEAHVAAGRVFYVDGKGIVRSLGLDKTVKQAAAFPIGPQQEVSFAVSPDGRHLLGTVLTIPPKPATDPCTSQGNGFAPGNWSEDVYAADAGGASRLISHRSWPAGQQADVLSFVGWDAIGPLGTSPTGYGTQGGGPIREGWYGRVVRVDEGSSVSLARIPATQMTWRSVEATSAQDRTASTCSTRMEARAGNSPPPTRGTWFRCFPRTFAMLKPSVR